MVPSDKVACKTSTASARSLAFGVARAGCAVAPFNSGTLEAGVGSLSSKATL